jgi:hypothetical protein
MTTSAEQRTRWWRSRAFVQPLLVTIVGVAALPAIWFAWSFFFVDRCTSCEVGYGIGQAIFYGIILLAAWCGGMLIAGLLVGRSSPDSRLAFGAILAAVASLALSVRIVVTSTSQTSESFLDIVEMFLGLAIVPVMAVGLGFGVGRLARPMPNDQPDSTGSG